ncbi:propanol-preferring alcohol dehydrogenase [Catenulispora sp. GAS73]
MAPDETTMDAWIVRRPGPIADGPLDLVRKPVPTPGPGELLVRVVACGVCRTDLHVSEGDLPVHREHVTPGHEVVGTVAALGPDTDADTDTDTDGSGFAVGDRVGVAWLRGTCGRCRFCLRGAENLCPYSAYTGWDADGGYAEFTTVPAAFAYRLPSGYTDAELAPLLCAGIIGYRALERAAVPAGGRLGIYGFGGSAHLAAQVALARGATVHVMTRGEKAKRLALDLGASSVSGAYEDPPEKLDSAILFAPVGDLVPVALRALDRGGVLAIAGIHLSDVPPLVYGRDLFYEREIRSVTANTRSDGEAFLRFATEHRLEVRTHEYPLRQAQKALQDLESGYFDGAAVLVGSS